MSHLEILLLVICVLLFLILLRVEKISDCMRQHWPTEKEADYDWVMKDPMGHWEAHKNDKKK